VTAWRRAYFAERRSLVREYWFAPSRKWKSVGKEVKTEKSGNQIKTRRGKESWEGKTAKAISPAINEAIGE